MGFLRTRFLSFAMVMGVAFLLLVSLLITAALASLGVVAEHLPVGVQWGAQIINVIVSFFVIILLFAMMFKWLPDAEVNWYDVWLGAVITAVFFEIGKAAIGFYIGKQGLESTYGAASSIVVVLIDSENV